MDTIRRIQLANVRNGEWGVVLDDCAHAAMRFARSRLTEDATDLDRWYPHWAGRVLMRFDANPRLTIWEAVDLTVAVCRGLGLVTSVARADRLQQFVNRTILLFRAAISEEFGLAL